MDSRCSTAETQEKEYENLQDSCNYKLLPESFRPLFFHYTAIANSSFGYVNLELSRISSCRLCLQNQFSSQFSREQARTHITRECSGRTNSGAIHLWAIDSKDEIPGNVHKLVLQHVIGLPKASRMTSILISYGTLYVWP